MGGGGGGSGFGGILFIVGGTYNFIDWPVTVQLPMLKEVLKQQVCNFIFIFYFI